MKKFSFLILLCAFFIISCPSKGEAATVQSKIILDSKEISMPANVQVHVVNENVMIPIRIVVENLKFKVDWDQKSQGVKIQQDTKIISLTVNQQEATVDGKQVVLTAAPQVKNETVLVPIRFVSEQMGISVSWDNLDKTVYLTSSNKESIDDGQAGTVEKVLPTTEAPEVSEVDTEPIASNGSGQTKNLLNHVNRLNFVNNQLIISSYGAMTPNISRLTNPDRIVVDLPNTTFDDSFGSLQPLDAGLKGILDVSGYPNVSEVRYSLFTRDPYQVRVVIALKQANAYQLMPDLDSNMLVIDLNVTEDSTTLVPPVIGSGRKIVVIDPGHGGSDPGTTSITNKHEKDFTLPLSLKVQALLLKEPNIRVVMTRDSDVYPTRPERVQLANQLKADVFVSIHGNSLLNSPQANGTETYYYQRSSSKDLANVIHKYLVKAIGLRDRGVKNESFQVIRETTMPAVLLEIGFLSNSAEEMILQSDDMQNKAAQAIVDGIKEYVGVK